MFILQKKKSTCVMLVCLVPVFIDLFFFLIKFPWIIYILICSFFTVTEKLRPLLFISLFNIMFFKSYEIPDDINFQDFWSLYSDSNRCSWINEWLILLLHMYGAFKSCRLRLYGICHIKRWWLIVDVHTNVHAFLKIISR